MGKTTQVASDRAFDQTRTVLPAEVARGIFMQNPPGLAALKVMHLLISKAGGRMGEDVEHRIRFSEVRAVEGLRNHDRASLTPLFAELQAAVLICDDVEQKRVTIGGLLDIAEIDYREESSGDLVISWYFSRMFTRAADASNHWAILDRQTIFHLGSRYSVLLFQNIASLAGLEHVYSKTFTVPELRAVLGVPENKHKRFAELNRWTIKPSIGEINQLSRFTLTATPHKIGRTVASVTISWQVKEDPNAARQELSRSKVGRRSRREGTVDTPLAAFPAEGSIRHHKPWASLAEKHGEGRDVTKIGNAFRAWWLGKGLSLDDPGIEAAFIGFCKKLGSSF